ncbi:MAG TPA: hypothetical protein VME70_04135 [Mycobacteriales bacterium]|nr:hypothetical protein [Mycobacteriales bacterium]
MGSDRVGRMTAASAAMAVALGAMVGLAPAPAAAAGSPKPVPYVLTTRLAVTTAARMVYANGKLFVTSGSLGSDVYVYSTIGKLLHTVTGEPGALGIVASADGSEVYVAQSSGSAIGVIDTTTYATSTLAEGAACPNYVALANGWLYYAWGCQSTYGQFMDGISSVNPATDATPTADVTGDYAPSLIAGGGDTLVVSDQGEEPSTLESYTASDGNVSDMVSTQQRLDGYGLADMAVSSNGSEVLLPGVTLNGVAEYSTATMTQTKKFSAAANSSAVAFSPDGTHVAGGYGGSDLACLYTTSSSTPLWSRIGASTSPSTWSSGSNNQLLPGTLTFSSDGSEVFGLVSPTSGTKAYLFSSTLDPKKTSLHLSLKRLTSSHQVIATAHLSSPGTVVFKQRVAGHTYDVGVGNTGPGGQLSIKFGAPYSALVAAEFEGSPSRYPSDAQKSFTMPSRARLKLSGYYAVSHGVRLFHSRKKVRFTASVLPVVINRPVTFDLQFLHNGKWRVVGTASDVLNKHGMFKLRLGPTATNQVQRVKLIFKGDKFNPASHAYSPPLEIT